MSSEPVVPELDRLKRKLRVTKDQSSAGKPRVRRVTRVIRDIDPWSVFKVGLAFHLVLYFVVLISLVLIWNVAKSTGTVDNVENFMESFGWETFKFVGGKIFSSLWVLGLFVVILYTGLWVLAATIFNLITDLSVVFG
ncbi:MAG: hypothetical protein RLZZ51_299 [Actinomycetota bacterium]